jgi:hypothetical protein
MSLEFQFEARAVAFAQVLQKATIRVYVSNV